MRQQQVVSVHVVDREHFARIARKDRLQDRASPGRHSEVDAARLAAVLVIAARAFPLAGQRLEKLKCRRRVKDNSLGTAGRRVRRPQWICQCEQQQRQTHGGNRSANRGFVHDPCPLKMRIERRRKHESAQSRCSATPQDPQNDAALYREICACNRGQPAARGFVQFP